MTRVVLHIDRLVLHGVDGADADAMRAALETELQRLLAVPGAESALTVRHRLAHWRAGTVRVDAAHGMRDTGRAVAKRIVRGDGQ